MARLVLWMSLHVIAACVRDQPGSGEPNGPASAAGTGAVAGSGSGSGSGSGWVAGSPAVSEWQGNSAPMLGDELATPMEAAGAPARDAGVPAVVVEPADEAAYIYDPSALRSYELRLTAEDLASIDLDPRAELYVPGTLVFEGAEYGPVGIRYKGSVGAFRECVASPLSAVPPPPGVPAGAKICTKLSMKVSFNWQTPAVEFFGLRKLQFHSMNRDRSMLKDRLGYSLFRQFGVPAPRAVHARLIVNGVFVGLFALVEQIDGRFTRSRFSEGGEGNLYQEAWPLDTARVPASASYLLSHLETNADQNPVFTPMLDFGKALGDAELATLPVVISRFTDIDAALRYVAVDRTIAHDDGPFHWYCGQAACANHNYFWYQEATAARLWMIAWDLDNAFNLDNATTTITPAWDDTSLPCAPQVYAPSVVPLMPPACDKLTLGWASMQQPYLDAVTRLLDGPLREDAVEPSLLAWEAQIAPVVQEAAQAHTDAVSVADWQTARDALRSSIATLRARARARVERRPVAIQDPWTAPDAGVAAAP